ncbi:MAG TPA: tail fiber protein [Gammaproteobacteria bacterium]|mgnify:CR=1 FL=1|nr:phage tail protein [Xanthomonadales bacterium]HOP21495.1 tail fiber protein [Gammaproteobacteria bacterium]HPI95505.1 tail fiber protein [Gammaproteobacteria bacterium]HPQ87248.1 tail fiber protein [Gammaproteobacteria bacterium]
MSEPFIAEIRIFAGNFAPRSWAFCNGQLLPISQNTALFSLIGTTYGGDGRSTTALPNLQGRAPMHPGRGPGLTARRLGERGGTQSVTLTEAQIPNHNHSVTADANPGGFGGGGADTPDPVNHYLASTSASGQFYANGNSNVVAMSEVTTAGGSQAHNNVQPVIAINYIIALQGLYPSRG